VLLSRYGAGQLAGWAFVLVLLALGARAIVKGREARALGTGRLAARP
jgi:hypothetical protein